MTETASGNSGATPTAGLSPSVASLKTAEQRLATAAREIIDASVGAGRTLGTGGLRKWRRGAALSYACHEVPTTDDR